MQLNSFILDSETIMRILPERVINSLEQYAYLGNLNIDKLLFPYIFMGVIVCVIVLAAKKRWKYRPAVYFFGAILLGRLVLFGNPLAWYYYDKTLDWKDVGFRQVAVIDSKLRYYIDPPEDVRFLAVGSSQTGAIYGRYAKINPSFYKIELSGFGPTEYYLYRGQIADVAPKHVLLYLSEFDLARKPSYDTYRYAPVQWGSLLPYTKALYGVDSSASMRKGLKELWIAQFLPEFRFSFIFKGYLKKWLSVNEVLDTGVNDFESASKEDATRNGIVTLANIFHSDAVEESLVGLTFLFEYCLDKNIGVIIVEGGYHPDAYNKKNIALKSRVRDELLDISLRYGNVEFITNDNLPQLSAADYVDGYHVGSNAGDELTNSVIDYIERNIE